MSKKYALEIYSPGSIEDVETYFESDTPFMSINVGDIINSRLWAKTLDEGVVLRVMKLEHFIWSAEDITKHKIGVITEVVEDKKDTRFQ